MDYWPDCEEYKDAVTESGKLCVIGQFGKLEEYVSKIMDYKHQWPSPKLF